MATMRVIVLILATATAVLSAGVLLVIFALPSTSIVASEIKSGGIAGIAGIASDAVVFGILVIALLASISVIISANHHASPRTGSVATMLVAISVAAALIDIVAEFLSSTYRQRGIWWLNVLLGLMALTYLSYRRFRTQIETTL
jgi:hypothetical protein